jgi:Peptidase family M28
MATTAQSIVGREQRVRDWIRALTELPDRFAGTPVERAAAERIGGWMRALAARDVSLEPVPSAPRAGFVLALHTGLALFGVWIGGFLGVLLTGVALWSFRSDLRRGRPRLARLLPASESVNVCGRLGATTPRRRVVLSAHIDSAQAGLLFAPSMADRFAQLAENLRSSGAPPTGPLVFPEALMITACVLTLASWMGAHGFLLGLLRVLVELGLALIVGLTLQWAWSPPTPGANDNASAVAAMLTCAERLAAELPDDVELWMVGTGAEEVGLCGMRGFVEQHASWPTETTYYVNFECVGGGTLHYIHSEGLLTKTHFPPALNEIARTMGAGGEFGEVTPTELLAATDGNVPAARGYPTLSLISLEANGVPRNYHRLDDTVDAIDTAMVVRAADFGAAVAAAALRARSTV